jgi:hypothetical protein
VADEGAERRDAGAAASRSSGTANGMPNGPPTVTVSPAWRSQRKCEAMPGKASPLYGSMPLQRRTQMVMRGRPVGPAAGRSATL